MKIFRVMLIVASLCFLSQRVSAETVIVKPGAVDTVAVGAIDIRISNIKSEYTIMMTNRDTKQVKMYLNFIFSGFESGMFFDEFGGKSVFIYCEKYDIRVEVK